MRGRIAISLKQLERAEAADGLWNAAQRQMVQGGWMHNYMRMYWEKRFWSGHPTGSRLRVAVTLNDRYELDGRDPNGYAGIAWAIVGRHDRPWFDRPIFGLIRPMSAAAQAKKFDTAAYIRQNGAKQGGKRTPSFFLRAFLPAIFAGNCGFCAASRFSHRPPAFRTIIRSTISKPKFCVFHMT